MQSRFCQFRSPFSAWWHYRRRVRSARRCGLLTALLLPGIAALLHGFPHHPAWQSEGTNANFTAVPYTEPETAQAPAPPAQAAARPALLAPQAPPPALPELCATEVTPAPLQEPEADIPQDNTLATPDTDTPFDDAPAPHARPAAPPSRRALAAAAPAAAATAERTPPAYRTAPKPPYPAVLRARRIGGSVGVRIAVSAEGIPTEVTITAPSGHRELDTTARQWILAHWRFIPAQANGMATAAHVQTRIDFIPS